MAKANEKKKTNEARKKNRRAAACRESFMRGFARKKKNYAKDAAAWAAKSEGRKVAEFPVPAPADKLAFKG